MKIQSEGAGSLLISTKTNQVLFNPSQKPKGETDIIGLSEPMSKTDIESKKVFNVPGEFEVSGILAQGFYTDDRNNVAFKVVMDETAIVHFGNLKEVPDAAFFEKLGENVDIIALTLNADFDDKKAKTLVDKLDPRMVLILGDETYFAGVKDKMTAKTAEEEELSITKSGLSDDKTDVIILKV